MPNKLHSKFHARLTVCLVGFLFLATVQAQQVLQVGRTEFPSPLSDIVERVMSEALQRRGLSAQFNKMPLLRSIAMTNDGALDADLLRIADAAKQYPNLVSVPTPVAMTHVALYGKDAKLVNLPRAEITNLKIGLTRGTLVLVKHSEGMSVTDTQTLGTTFQMLQNDRFDIAMMIHIDAELEIDKNYPAGFARRANYWASEPVYFHLNKKHLALVPKINSALQEMQKEGLISKYYEEGLQKINVKPLKPAS
jgi:polar amino acid transport system substrate-binding protein